MEPEPIQPTTGPSPDSEPGNTAVLLAEYNALRAELDRRAGTQWNVVALQVSSAGVLTSLAIADAAHAALLLLLPLSSYVFGSRYVLHDYHIKLINRYVQDSLSPRLGGQLQWQTWKPGQMAADLAGGKPPGAVRWNALHPTRLVLEGVALLALAGATWVGIASWVDDAPAVHVIAGLLCLWILGVIALIALESSFRRSS